MNFSLARYAPLSLLSAAIALVVGLAPQAEAQILNGCMEDVAGFSLNCNANDIRIASVTNVVVLDDGCTAPGDTVTFNATVEVLLTSTARFDVGIYLAADGGDALNGSCFIDTLPTGPTPPFVNLDGGGDTCGDIDSSHNPIFDDVNGLTVACVDTDNDGFLDLPNCLSWRQPGANDLCTSPVDAFPGSPSKCRCDTINVTAIHVPPGEIVVTKTASPSQVNEPGGNVTFTFTVSNPALVKITLQSLVDNIYGDLNGQGSCSVPRTINPGGSYSCSISVFVAGNGSQSETDVVTAAGVDVTGNAVSDTDDATVSVVDLPSAIEIVKTASPDVVLEPGGPVNFTFLINNLSAADTVVINTLVDTIYGNLDGLGTCSAPQTIPPGGSYACSFSAQVTGMAGDSETNVVTALGSDDDGQPVSDSDSATVTIADVPSAIQVTKSASPDTVTEPGGTVTFSFVVQNLSAVDTVTITSLIDSIHGNLNGQGTCSVPQTIPPGGSYPCSFSAVVSGSPGETETNVVTAAGTDDDGEPVSDDDSATVTIADDPASIQVLKTATPAMVQEPGGPVTFSFMVTNLSAVDTVTIDTLIDTIYGDLDGRGTCSVPQVLAPGGSYSCSFSANVSGQSGDTETDVVTASGTDDDGGEVSDQDDATVTIANVASAINVTKDANPGSVLEPGAPVTFTVEITNLSPADSVTITSLIDTIHGNLSGQGTCSVPKTLAPGATYTCSFTANVTGGAGDVELDVVTASGTDDDGEPVTDSDSATVTIVDVPSALEVRKNANPNSILEPGATVTFTFVLENLSPVDTLTIDTLVDSIYGDLDGRGTCSVPQTLAPHATYTCTFDANVTGQPGDIETDVVTASGEDDDGNPVTDDDSATVTIVDSPSAIEITKTANPAVIEEPDGSVTFSFVVTNVSAVDTVTITTLTDTIYGNLNGRGTCSVPQVIPPGDSYSCSFTATVSGGGGDTETNVVTAKGTDDDGKEVSDQDDATVTITDLPSNIEVIKSASPSALPEPGGTFTFTVVVNNLSQVDTVTINSLADNIHGNLNGQGTCSVPQTIPHGGSYVCSFTAAVTGPPLTSQTDVVLASGTDDDGKQVSDSDDATVTIQDVPSAIRVTKTALPDFIAEPGGNVTFNVVISNLSITDTVVIDSLIDSIHGNLDGKGSCSVPQSILPGGSYSCSFQASVTGPPGHFEMDIVTAEGTDDDGVTVGDDDTATVTIFDVPSEIQVLKVADPTIVDVGHPVPVTFDVTVHNISAVDTVTITSLVDSIHGNLNGQGTCSVPQTLPPGGSYTCSFTASVVGAAGQSETDVVTASGTDDDGKSVSDTDDAVVDLILCGDGVLQTGEECDDGNTAFGDGCTPFCRNEVPITAICNHPCPSKLTFNGPDVDCSDPQDPARARLDKFYTKIGFFPSTPLFNPATDGIGVELRNSSGVIYSITMQPGALVKEGRSYRYRDPFGATGQGGVRFMGMNLRNDGLWRLEIKAYGDLQCLADEAEMTLIVLAGNDVFTKTATWRELGRGGGWIVNFKQL